MQHSESALARTLGSAVTKSVNLVLQELALDEALGDLALVCDNLGLSEELIVIDVGSAFRVLLGNAYELSLECREDVSSESVCKLSASS